MTKSVPRGKDIVNILFLGALFTFALPVYGAVLFEQNQADTSFAFTADSDVMQVNVPTQYLDTSNDGYTIIKGVTLKLQFDQAAHTAGGTVNISILGCYNASSSPSFLDSSPFCYNFPDNILTHTLTAEELNGAPHDITFTSPVGAVIPWSPPYCAGICDYTYLIRAIAGSGSVFKVGDKIFGSSLDVYGATGTPYRSRAVNHSIDMNEIQDIAFAVCDTEECAFSVLPPVSFAEEIDAIMKVHHAGVDIYDGDTKIKSDFLYATSFWTFTFKWPYQVPNNRAYFFIARGEFGNPEGDTLQEYVNYSTQLQAWGTGTSTISKPMGAYGFAHLWHASTTSSMYTVMIAELQAGNAATYTGVKEWFATGGISGIAPIKHSFLTFNYLEEESSGVPVLTYTDEEGFLPDAESPGVHPNKGTASSTPMVFKVVYTGTDAPDAMNVLVGNGTATTSYPMAFDATTASTTLRDGIFTNGEQYIATPTFPKGKYQYYFEAQNASTTVYLPADGTLSFQTGYSNVAFLPGLEASRLYVQEGLFENQLWTPNTNNDVGKLALSPITGESINPDIYTNDVVDEAYTINIYKGFLEHMNAMVATGDIKEFESLPYDWRMDVRDVATRVIPLRNSGYTMVSRVEEMASASPTGKVTIITHSNGGLVAKELINELERQGKAHLVDRVIMVAAPELGTPKAILEMLHGPDFFFPNFPSKEVTRELAENMKSAYTLLPSQEYFNRLGTSIRPVIEFDAATPVTEALRAIYGDSISDYDALRRFLRGEYGGRAEPLSGEVNIPNILKEHFLVNAEDRHKELDPWAPPEGIDVIEVVGGGLDTPRGIRYESAEKNVCNEDLSVCQVTDVIDPQPLITSEGDGTVVSVSAEALGGERYYVEMDKYNFSGLLGSTINRSHKNILEIEPLQNLITTLIKHEATSTLPAFVSSSTPTVSDPTKRLRVSVHSPVSLHLYDEFGRHTGPIPNPDPLSDIKLFEEQIPNSYYWHIGEGQYAGGGYASTTAVQLEGLSLGTFTLKIEEVIGEETTNTILYKNIPTTGSTTASIQVGGDITTPLLMIDINGDGTTDVFIGEGENVNILSLEMLEDIIGEMDIRRGLKKDIVKAIEKATKELEKDKALKTVKELDKIIKKLQKEIKKNTNSEEEDDEHEKNDEDKHAGDKRERGKEDHEDDREDDKGDENEDRQKISTEDAQKLIEIIGKIASGMVE
ncbi:MAG: hypothetical protein NUV49_00810 [Patescibacteria group bacterium]|nr:hypothetical protein [Patescibacteria group bacterium]